jgi:hypothetical protein
VDQSYPVGSTLADFHRLIPFRKLAILLDRDLLQAIPQLKASATALVREAGAQLGAASSPPQPRRPALVRGVGLNPRTGRRNRHPRIVRIDAAIRRIPRAGHHDYRQ